MKKIIIILVLLASFTEADSQTIYKLGSPNGLVKSLGILTADSTIRVPWYPDTTSAGSAKSYGSIIVTGADSTKLWWYSKRWNAIVDNHTTGTFVTLSQLNDSLAKKIAYSDTLIKIVTLSRLNDSLNLKQDTLGFTPEYVYNITDPKYGATPHYIDSTDDDTRGIQYATLATCGYSHVGYNSGTHQDTIRQINTHAGGTVYTPNGIFNVKGPLIKSVVQLMLDGSTVIKPVNAQIYIPYVYDSNRAKINPIGIEFLGQSIPELSMETPTSSTNRTNWTNGANWLSNASNDASTYPAVIASVTGDFVLSCCSPNIIFPVFNYMWVTSKFDSTAGGTQTCGIFMADALDAMVIDSRVDVNFNSINYYNFNHTQNVVGIFLPNTGQGTVNGVTRATVIGYKFGIVAGEHAILDNPFLAVNNWGLEQMPSFHTVAWRDMNFHWNKRQIGTGHLPSVYTGIVGAMVNGTIRIERDCFNFQYDIDDSLSILTGKVSFETRNLHSGCPGGATAQGILLNGATKLYINAIDSLTIKKGSLIIAQNSSGNIGINKYPVSSNFDVTGNQTVVGSFTSTTSGNTQFIVSAVSGNNSNFVLQNGASSQWFISNNAAASANKYGIFNNPGVERFGITQAGVVNFNNSAFTETTSDNRLGLNTIAPSYTFDLRSPNQIGANFQSTFSGNCIYQFASTNGFNTNLLFVNGATNKWYISNISSNNRYSITDDDASTNNERFVILQTGQTGISTVAPTAMLHLPAGTATASTAPLKFTAGVRLATPEAGAVEYDSLIYVTLSTIRRPIFLAGYNLQSGTTYTIVTLDFGKIVAMSNVAARTITLPAASSIPAGYPVTIKDQAGTALTANIVINRSGSDTIDGATSYTMNLNYQAVDIYSDGVSKFFLK